MSLLRKIDNFVENTADANTYDEINELHDQELKVLLCCALSNLTDVPTSVELE